MNEYPHNEPDPSEDEYSTEYNQRQRELQLHEEERRLQEEERRVRQGQHNLMISRLIRGVYFLVGALTTLLVLRFILKLAGANPENMFAQFIYDFSSPFVSPFTNLFEDLALNSNNIFEINTIVAIIIYGLLGMLGVRLIEVLGEQ